MEEFLYTVTYMKCQSCSARSHCGQCSRELEPVLAASPGVETAFLDLEHKTVRLTAQSEDAALDALDDAGIFPA